MSAIDAQDLAGRAGVEAAYVDRLRALGILPEAPPGPDGNVRRIRIVQALEEAGLPLEGLAAAIREGRVGLDFVDQPSYSQFAAYTTETFRQASERTGVPLDLVIAVREATGSARPEPDGRMREGELEIVDNLRIQLVHGVRPEVAERALRATGDAARRMAEIASDWWRTEILGPLFASGSDVATIGEVTAKLAEDITDSSDRSLLALIHGQQAHSWMRNIVDGIEATVAAAGLHNRLDKPPAIAFLDLSGYTRLTEEHGDAAAAGLASRLATMVQRTSQLHGGRAVKWLGDGVMFYFHDPGHAMVASLAMVDGAVAEGMPPAHVGIHAGPVLRQEGDYFGRTVNAASRISDYAGPGEVVVSQEVVDAAGEAPVDVSTLGAVELPGLAEPLHLLVARSRV